ncbi:hypothetical protein HXA31_09415 [Salipaludibacillus agaradhaerens]|uniref:Tetratricopeptide repeat protein n=1 Tax=Salipaludibacillus agaradhaerens TaxID=76935 RepID=A0A9Q4B030_SALAG|nr:hypothetical protein [Salipaludibacillus agaradhaerens]MCR6095849.1 hypothetical protein [Salipaludibacillus agaradhaerens]MCR6114591.1 hypothetical protein [Salipaludibacillus agaradhaerens]
MFKKSSDDFNSQTERNLKGKELEKNGDIEKAIELYELNVRSEFPGNFPYDCLAIIYRKKKNYDEEIRVLQKAIEVFVGERIKRNRGTQRIEGRL